MDIIHIVGSLAATVVMTMLFYVVAASRRSRAEVSTSEFADTALALLFLTVFVLTFGWCAAAVMPQFDSVPIGLIVTAATFFATVTATTYLMGTRKQRSVREDAPVRQ